MSYPENILRIVRQNLDLEPTDTIKDDDINAMSQPEIANGKDLSVMVEPSVVG